MTDISHLGQGDAIMNNPYVRSVHKQRLSVNEHPQKNDDTKEVNGLLGHWNWVTQHSYFCCQAVNLQFPFHAWHSSQVHIKLQSRYKAEKMIQKFPRDDVFEARKIANFLRLVLWTFRETLSFCHLEDRIWHGLKLLWLLMQDLVLVWSQSHYVHHNDIVFSVLTEAETCLPIFHVQSDGETLPSWVSVAFLEAIGRISSDVG